MQNFLTNLFQFVKRKPLLSLAFFTITLIIIISLFPKKSYPSTNSTLPTVNLENNNPDQKPTTAFSELTFKDLPRQIEVYQITSPAKNKIMELFNPIASEFNFSNPPETTDINQLPHLFWDNAPNFLTVNLQSGAFTLDFHPQTPTSTASIIELDAVNIAKNWLLKYKLITEDAKFESKRIQDLLGGNTTPPEQENWQISFFPTMNNLPIFTPNAIVPPISVIVTPQGNIYSVYYQLPVNSLTQIKSTNHPVLTSDQIDQAIKNNQPVIKSLIAPNGDYAPSNTNIKSAKYQQITLGYSNEINSGYLLPVFQLTGTAELDNGKNVIVTAYLPALAE